MRKCQAQQYGVAQLVHIGIQVHIFNQYTIAVDCRELLLQHFRDRDIGCEVYYPVPLHLQPCFSELGYVQNSLPEAEKASSRVLSIPIYPELSGDQIEYVAATVVAFLNKRKSNHAIT